MSGTHPLAWLCASAPPRERSRPAVSSTSASGSVAPQRFCPEPITIPGLLDLVRVVAREGWAGGKNIAPATRPGRRRGGDQQSGRETSGQLLPRHPAKPYRRARVPDSRSAGSHPRRPPPHPGRGRTPVPVIGPNGGHRRGRHANPSGRAAPRRDWQETPFSRQSHLSDGGTRLGCRVSQEGLSGAQRSAGRDAALLVPRAD